MFVNSGSRIGRGRRGLGDLPVDIGFGTATVSVRDYATLAQAYAALPSTGGSVLVPPGYTETLTADLTLNKAYCGIVFLGTATITCGVFHIIMGTSVNGVFMRGQGAYQSDISGTGTVGVNIISSVTTGAAISLGATGQRTNYHTLANVVVDMRAAAAGTYAVQLIRTVFWTIDHVTLAGGNLANTGLQIDGTLADFGGFGEIIKPQIRNFKFGIVTTGSANAIQMYGGIVDCNSVASSVGLTRDGTLIATAGFTINGTEISTAITGISMVATVTGDRYTLYSENNTTDIVAGASTSLNTAEFFLAFTKTDSGTNNDFRRLGKHAAVDHSNGVTGSGAIVLAAAPTLSGAVIHSGTSTLQDDTTVQKNQNATTTFSLLNTDTTNSSSRSQFTFQGGSVAGRMLAINGDAFYLGSTNASPFNLQYNNVNQIAFNGTTIAGQVPFVNTAATATPAGGSTAARLLFGTTAGFGIYYGSGVPTVSAASGSLYIRTDNAGANLRLYSNTTGSTTWAAITSA